MTYFDTLIMFSKEINSNNKNNYRYFYSIRDKLEIHKYFRIQFDNYYEIVKNERIVFEIRNWPKLMLIEDKYKLVAYFEASLNNLYSIMENIAKITKVFFPKCSLPDSFHDQLKWFTKQKEFEDQEYCLYLVKNMYWYYQLQELRTEPVHYLSGLINLKKDIPNQNVPYYFNLINSQRKKKIIKSDHISINPKSIHKLGNHIEQFLEFFAQHFLKKLDINLKIQLPSITEDQNGKIIIKKTSITLREMLYSNKKKR